MVKETVEFRGEVLADGRKRVTVSHPGTSYRTNTYTTVRNIDGSNRLMADGSYWSFLPHDYEYAAYSALAKAEGQEYVWQHCVPVNHVVTA